MALAYLGRNNIVTTPWNSERDAVLVQMWADGHSASAIAKQLEDVVSRCAVIGRAHRLKLPARAPRQKQRKVERKPRQWKPKPKLLPPAPAAPVAPRTRMLTLLELKPTSCRFPIGDGSPWLFCGADADETYCPFHQRIAKRRG